MSDAIRYYATGHRKNATAKVWLVPGNGEVSVNGRTLADFVGRRALEMIVRQPLETTASTDRFNVVAKTLGGGIAGQAGAIRHGIAKALVIADENLKPALRKYGFLTRDPRVKERKKYGRKRARRGFQFSKR
ncbi:MAG TPA: 30S ribosomal protein S9 [Armatimonadota bacterium]|nr:30S ribosomal protein S9 [Armatimonadota bacterium]